MRNAFIYLLVLAVFISACTKPKDSAKVAELTTKAVSEITESSAISGGNVTANGGAEVIARGVCWSTNQNPTINDKYTSDGKGEGIFSSEITGLEAETTYYVRAYAINSEGTAYGNEESFSTSAKTTLSVTLSGRDSYENISVGLYKKSEPLIRFVTKEVENAKASFDVAEYIGEELTIKAIEKMSDGTEPPIAKINKTIENGDNSVSLEIPKKKVYDANIKVTKGGEPVKNVKVFAVDNVAKLLLNNIAIGGSNMLKNAPNTTTNENGLAKFTNLPITAGTTYNFVVVTQEANIPAGIKGKYKKIELTLDGTLQEGEIELPTTKLTVNITSSNALKGVEIRLYTNSVAATYAFDDAKYYPNMKTIDADDTKKVVFEDIPEGSYYIYAKKKGACLASVKIVAVQVENGSEIEKNITIKGIGKITLESTSENPYTVTITKSDDTKTSFVMEGETKKTVEVPLGATEIYVKQNSGYAFYPTKKNYTVNVACGSTETVNFPK